MRIETAITPIRSFYLPSGRVIVSRTNDGSLIESTEMRDVSVQGKEHEEVRNSLDPEVIWKHLVPTEEKWLLTVSTQKGCSYKCRFCDVSRLKFNGNLTKNEIVEQIVMLVESTPELKTVGTKKAKIGFARMGEPKHNLQNVLETMRLLPVMSWLNNWPIEWLPCFNTIVPTKIVYDDKVIDWYDALMKVLDVKDYFDGNLHLQISCNSTDENKRKWLFGGADVAPLEDIIGAFKFKEIKGRTITLNFIAMKHVEVSVEKLLNFGLTPDKFAVKLISMNRTNASTENDLETEFDYQHIERMEKLKEEFKRVGVPVVVDATAKCEGAGLCCGQTIETFWPKEK